MFVLDPIHRACFLIHLAAVYDTMINLPVRGHTEHTNPKHCRGYFVVKCFPPPPSSFVRSFFFIPVFCHLCLCCRESWRSRDWMTCDSDAQQTQKEHKQ